ncbi:MAG TPA: MarR family transcriptional regulator [Acidimicrobiales bacterium]|nr:MarR family transcriptional regulator [Acidimicrobiales bacterium]
MASKRSICSVGYLSISPLATDPTPADVADRLHSAAIRLLRRVRREDEATGLTGARLSALSAVVFGGPLTVGQLAAAEQVRSPTASKLVTELEALGLVTRASSPNDGRVSEVRATVRGRWMLQAGRRRRVANLTGRLSDLGPDDLAVLDRAAEILEAVLSDQGDQEVPPPGDP